MRGKAEVRHERDQEPGITPACAGKRHCPRFRPGKTRDHPRVCGEKSSLMQMDVGPLGSPPRMRGKGCYMQELSGETGITLAYAGKSRSRRTTVRPLRDHPRVCGEKGPVGCKKTCGEGSPPRVRGKVVRGMQQALRYRITPACAGKSLTIQKLSTLRKDHPRVCGEKLKIPCWIAPNVGSPPRVRGKVVCHACVCRDLGITPACAGKRSQNTTNEETFGDHPRVCGEKVFSIHQIFIF